MKIKEALFYSIIAGFTITLISAISPINGAPWPWLTKGGIIFSTFLIDAAIWTITTLLGYLLFEEYRAK